MNNKYINKFSKALFLTSIIIGTSSNLVNAQTTFNNTASVTINDDAPASIYPSPITVSGMSGTITNLTVTLKNVSHDWASDVSFLLQAPTGQALMLQSWAADGDVLSNATYTISDAGATQLDANIGWTSGTYKPTNYSYEIFALPAPPSPPGVGTYNTPGPFGVFAGNPTTYATLASTFNGLSPNGQWKLYIQDFSAPDGGVMAGGWSLTITTSNFALPVTFNNVMANCINNKATISWSYSAENNLDYFEIMKSNDGQNFETIGNVKHRGVNKINSFQTNLENEKELQFFKIKGVDLDKKESFSKVVSTKCVEKETVKVYPTITSNTINIVSPNEEIIALEIIDNLGNVIFKQKNMATNTYFLNLNDLSVANGNYTIRVVRNENIDVFKITKE